MRGECCPRQSRDSRCWRWTRASFRSSARPRFVDVKMRLIALWRQSLFSQINVSLLVPIQQRIVKVDPSKPMQRS